MTNKDNSFLIDSIIFFFIAIIVFVSMGTIWTGGSFVTSVVKATTGQCDGTLGIEPAFDGNWFCPTRKPK